MISVKIPNLPKFQKALKKFPELAQREIGEAMKKSLYQIERNTKPITPIDTGRLRGSIGSGGEGIFQIKKLWAAIGTNVKYAIYVHEGTNRMPARPFLKLGTEKSINNIKQFFKEAITNIFTTIARKSK